MSRILWHGVAPWVGTGYGTQCELTTRKLVEDGHDVTISAYAGWIMGKTSYEGIPILPGDTRYGNDVLRGYIDHVEADLTVALLDPWVLNRKIFEGRNVACWTPVDHEPLAHPHLTKFFEGPDASRPIAMSRFGERVMRDAGLDPIYIPHAIDTKVFKPMGRREARDALGLPQDDFIVGMVATNQGLPPRKGWPEAFLAFREFSERHRDARLYLHTRLAPNDGLNLGFLRERASGPAWFSDYETGIDTDRISGITQLAYMIGPNTDHMVETFSAFDVLLSPSYGEGFGLCTLEAQACGTPVIVTNASAQPQLCGAGWLVDAEPSYESSYNSWWARPRVSGIVDALESAYLRAESRRDAAREFALEYDIDLVYDRYWRPALDELLGSATGGGAEPSIHLNRQQRRALAKGRA